MLNACRLNLQNRYMKLLNLTQVRRDYFIAGKALYVDDDDKEALRGLNTAG